MLPWIVGNKSLYYLLPELDPSCGLKLLQLDPIPSLSQDQLSAMLQALHSPRIGPSGDSQTFETEFHMKQISIHQVPEMI